MSPYRRGLVARCRCGHEASAHEVLPGHPDGAWECSGEDRSVRGEDGPVQCACGRLDVVMRAKDRWA